MIHKTLSSKPGHIRVTFELPPCIWADRIDLVGDFNDWSPGVNPFRQDRDGVWRAVLDLPAGRSYEFRYLVDGEWTTDYHADGFAMNNYGTHNSVIHTDWPASRFPGKPAHWKVAETPAAARSSVSLERLPFKQREQKAVA